MSLNLEMKKEHMFMWRIKDLKLCTVLKGKYFESPVFRAKSLQDTSWSVILYPRGHNESKDGYMGCYLNRSKIDNGDHKIECEFEISIMSGEGKTLQSNRTSHIFIKNECWGWRNFFKKSAESFDANDDLLIRCELKSNAQVYSFRSESSGITIFDSDQSSFRWIVKNVNSDCSELIKFPYTGTSQVEVSLEVPDDDIKITIRRGEGVTEFLSVFCQITLIDVKGGKHDSRQALHLFERIDSSTKNDIRQFPNFLKKSKLNSEKEKYLRSDCFTLLCKIAVSNGTKTDSVEDKECGPSAVDNSPPDIGIITVLEDYRRLYRDKIHADVKLHVEDQIIQAHKNILSVRSPVFHAMFDTGMIENETGSVKILDLDAKTVNSLLEYMYSGTVEKLDYEIATKLIVSANKYQVLSLKEKCAHFMKSIMAQANVCEILIVSDLIQHEVLKDAAVNYIKENSEYIFLSEEWNSVVERNFKLATDTFSKVSKLTAVDRKKLEKK